jgi:hypothetical protein
VKHWKADAGLAQPPPKKKARGPRLGAPAVLDRWARVDSFEQPKAQRRGAEWSGAIAGLVLVATACVGLCFVLYQVTGPRDTFAEGEGPGE